MGRVEGRRPHDSNPSTILRMVPLPNRCANGEETRTAHNPPIASISPAANPLTPLVFQKLQRHEPSALSRVPDSSHPVGGEGVGSSAPMSAGCGRAMKPGGWIPRGSLRRSVDGFCLLAARFLCGLLTARPSCPPRAVGSNVCGAIRSGPNSGPLPGGRVENGCAGQVPSLPDRDFTGGSEGRPRSGFVETVTLQQHRARPGRPAPSPTFPAAMPAGEDAWMEGGWWLVASGQWLAIAAHLSAEGRRRRPPRSRRRPTTSH